MRSTSTTSKVAGASGDAGRADFVEQNLLTYLRETQNSDGGWGFVQGAASRMEPTAWALIALSEIRSSRKPDETLSRGFQYVETRQLPDGSWPAASGQYKGSWVTALACWALLVRDECAALGVARGVEWLLKNKPGEAAFLLRTVRRLTAARQVTSQNPDYFGWSWTPGTASWVEPTAFALLVLTRAMDGGLFRGQARGSVAGFLLRTESAEKMLGDRMCPGGGWNAGNPMVYGVAGEPQVGPTVWALLALRKKTDRPEVQKSLDWLAANRDQVRSLESMALTQIALEAFGRSYSELRSALVELWTNEDHPRTVQGAAWSALAMSKERGWLMAARHEAAD
jgi:hypothetical protein